MTRRIRVAVVALVTAAAALVTLTGCATLNTEQNAVPTAVPSELDPVSSLHPTTPPSSGAFPLHRATVPPVPPEAAAPARVRVDWAGIDAAVQPVGVDGNGQMALPPNPAEVGWYRFSAAPSATLGSTVLAAHVDAVGYGVGPFAHLVDVPKGTRITVTDTAHHQTHYRIDSVSLLTKTVVPWQSLFTTTGSRRLVLVTCGGAFDYSTHHYLSNLVITATLA